MGICTEVPFGEVFPCESGSEYESDEESRGEDVGSQDEWDGQSGWDNADGLDFSGLSLDDDACGSDGGQPKKQAMVMKKNSFWRTGQVIRVRCLGGRKGIHEEVEYYAKIWEKYANIKFRFVRRGPAEIRISFHPKRGHWSKVGTDALEVTDQRKATMNLAGTSRQRLKRHVLHEFGHALGCLHEHSSPASPIRWNQKAVYAHYAKQGWSKAKVRFNVFNKYAGRTVTQFSRFDPHSIMIYPIESKLTKDGFKVEFNQDLSATDKSFIAKMYPRTDYRRRSSGQTSSGQEHHALHRQGNSRPVNRNRQPGPWGSRSPPRRESGVGGSGGNRNRQGLWSSRSPPRRRRGGGNGGVGRPPGIWNHGQEQFWGPGPAFPMQQPRPGVYGPQFVQVLPPPVFFPQFGPPFVPTYNNNPFPQGIDFMW